MDQHSQFHTEYLAASPFRPPASPATTDDVKAAIERLARHIAQMEAEITDLAERLKAPANSEDSPSPKLNASEAAQFISDILVGKGQGQTDLTMIRNFVLKMEWALDNYVGDIVLTLIRWRAIAQLSDEFKGYLRSGHS